MTDITKIMDVDINNISKIMKINRSNMSKFMVVSAGEEGPSGGELWAWGHNEFGQLGLGDTTDRSSPVQVGSLNTWDTVAAAGRYAVAIKTDGTLWAWGRNDIGQLGLGDTIYRSSPVQVGSLNNWSKVSCRYSHSVAIKTDGTLWAWGRNSAGQLGLGDTSKPGIYSKDVVYYRGFRRVRKRLAEDPTAFAKLYAIRHYSFYSIWSS